LLRRRGKVDKAIKVHQTLLARPGLEADMADAARIQLAQDYISGGLLDRAERLLKELMQENSVAKWEALQLLITIYQTEKEWESAVACTQELLSNARYKKDSDWNARAAHYCCEIAEQFIDKEENGKARDSIKRAFGFRRHSVRAAVLLARIEQRLGNFKAANREYLRIMQQNPAFVPQILKAMRKSFAAIDKLPGFKHSLSDHVSNHFDPVALNMLVQLITESDGSEAAIRFLRMKIASEPSVTAATQLLKLEAGLQEEAQATDLERIHQMLENMLKKRAGYQCNQCGYESKNLYWLCPSCHTWDSIEPNYKNGI
jgi:lipopolysaccharide biosynthesis regulator YciM